MPSDQIIVELFTGLTRPADRAGRFSKSQRSGPVRSGRVTRYSKSQGSGRVGSGRKASKISRVGSGGQLSKAQTEKKSRVVQQPLTSKFGYTPSPSSLGCLRVWPTLYVTIIICFRRRRVGRTNVFCMKITHYCCTAVPCWYIPVLYRYVLLRTPYVLIVLLYRRRFRWRSSRLLRHSKSAGKEACVGGGGHIPVCCLT